MKNNIPMAEVLEAPPQDASTLRTAKEITLDVSEIFYSLQGEGARAGEPSIFVRLQGCKAQHACYASGIRCDTEFESGRPYALTDLLQALHQYPCKTIIWTGGEPLQQLTELHIAFFKQQGFYQCVETSGLFPCPKGMDYIAISPKVAEHVLAKNFNGVKVDELRYVRHSGQDIPQPALKARHYLLSPHSDGMQLNMDNLKHCMDLCLQHPQWALSIQMHKIWQIL